MHKDHMKLLICSVYEWLNVEWKRVKATCRSGKRYCQVWINVKLDSWLTSAAAQFPGFVLANRLAQFQ